jgi:hypothetical protein
MATRSFRYIDQREDALKRAPTQFKEDAMKRAPTQFKPVRLHRRGQK